MTNLYRWFSGWVFLMLASTCYAQVVKLTPADKQLLLTEEFRVVVKTKDLPASVRKEFARATHARTFQMADPGQEFQSTDFILNKRLADRRLIAAGLADDLCVLLYEHGGRGLNYNLVLFHLSGGHAHFVWHGDTISCKPNMSMVRQYIRNSKYDDADSHYM